MIDKKAASEYMDCDFSQLTTKPGKLELLHGKAFFATERIEADPALNSLANWVQVSDEDVTRFKTVAGFRVARIRFRKAKPKPTESSEPI